MYIGTDGIIVSQKYPVLILCKLSIVCSDKERGKEVMSETLHLYDYSMRKWSHVCKAVVCYEDYVPHLYYNYYN